MIYTIQECQLAFEFYRKLSRIHREAGNGLEATHCKIQEVWFLQEITRLTMPRETTT